MILCRVVKPCARCVIVNTNPWSGARDAEPLKTLSGFRARESKVYFAQNVVHARDSIGQWVAVGDEVSVETRRDLGDELKLGSSNAFTNDEGAR